MSGYLYHFAWGKPKDNINSRLNPLYLLTIWLAHYGIWWK